ncbi:dihydrofolate reductase family protein [Hamadaea sp. NPDC050747]|uniref:dihydrofolate reductase family protein n=1 Tax=Hamadaea sp. NPDC050747 TaxID=3155789 RepID=UPI0033F22865
MKLTVTTHITVDGVVQGNGGRSENRSGGFERGGWARPYFHPESAEHINQIYASADTFLFGRRTYDLFAGYWGLQAPGSGPIADSLNTRPKYVVSNTLTDPGWAGTTVLSGGSDEVAAAVRELAAKPGGDLQVHGSGTLTRWLLENHLVDQLNLFVFPVILGQGRRLFAESGPDLALDLAESRAFPNGVMLQVYRSAGLPQYAD